MKKYCLVGEKLGHSLSPQIHKLLFEYGKIDGEYELFEMSKEEVLTSKSQLLQFDGYNVTVPYKEKIMNLLDEKSAETAQIGAVNTVKNDNGKLIGFNTDPYGFEALLCQNAIHVDKNVCVILGSGGACKAVVACLLQRGAREIVIVTRSKQETKAKFEQSNLYVGQVKFADYDELKSIQGYLLVNATPIGMSPKVDCSPIDEEIMDNFEVAVDTIYNPVKTKFLQSALAHKKLAVNGLYMLVAQAVKSEEIWNNRVFGQQIIGKIYGEIKKNFDRKSGGNIYLTGMMACGKTTLGKKLAESLGWNFVDSDEFIVAKTGKSISKLFALGEQYFRDIESEAIAELCALNNTVVACGGGVILRQINVCNMRLSGTVCYIERDIDLIATDKALEGRPLLKDGASKLYEIFGEREEKYQQTADIIIGNNGKIDDGLRNLRLSLEI